MRNLTILVALGLALAGAGARAAERTPASDEERAVYVVGRQIGQGLGKFHLTRSEAEFLVRGLRDALEAAPSPVDLEKYGVERMEAWQAAREKAGLQLELEKGKAFAERAAREQGAKRLESGVVFTELSAGAGEPASSGRRYRVHVRGRLTSGLEFDNSYSRKRPLTLEIHPRFPACWTAPLKQMRVGGKARVVCPPSTAYGDFGRPPLVDPGATVVYELEVLEVARE